MNSLILEVIRPMSEATVAAQELIEENSKIAREAGCAIARERRAIPHATDRSERR